MIIPLCQAEYAGCSSGGGRNINHSGQSNDDNVRLESVGTEASK